MQRHKLLTVCDHPESKCRPKEEHRRHGQARVQLPHPWFVACMTCAEPCERSANTHGKEVEQPVNAEEHVTVPISIPIVDSASDEIDPHSPAGIRHSLDLTRRHIGRPEQRCREIFKHFIVLVTRPHLPSKPKLDPTRDEGDTSISDVVNATERCVEFGSVEPCGVSIGYLCDVSRGVISSDDHVRVDHGLVLASRLVLEAYAEPCGDGGMHAHGEQHRRDERFVHPRERHACVELNGAYPKWGDVIARSRKRTGTCALDKTPRGADRLCNGRCQNIRPPLREG
mmetsp:Transcript_42488/g.99970  ORF Transcript_42488/g.99970 Transcript_42488/m.99970 type:complete len:284 (-) Transcript_42488:424-1275(-)